MEEVWTAVEWFERNAVTIAALEFAILVICGPGKMIFDWLRYRSLMREQRRIESEAKQRHQELIDIRAVMARIEMKPLGDKARYGKLPEGTNIVETKEGQVLLALPVRLGGIPTLEAGGSATLTATKAQDDDPTLA